MPIDPNFQKNRKKVGKDEGITIWGPVNPPRKLGVRGSNVAVDWDVCTGCTICAKECPWETIAMVAGTDVEELLSEEITEDV